MKSRVFSIITAAVLLLFSTFSTGAAFALRNTAEDHDPHDYSMLAAFLETEDEDGVKNGTKLSADYSVSDPSTWEGTVWTDEDVKRLESFTAPDKGLVGRLDLSECSALRRVDLPSNSITKLRVSACPELTYLVCSFNELDALDAAGCSSLIFLHCMGNRLTELDVSSLSGLQTLNCSQNLLTELNIDGLSSLMTLDCAENLLTGLDISGSPELYYLDCGDNALTELDVSNLYGLNTLYCAGNGLTAIELSNNAQLRSFDFRRNRLRYIDLTACESLYFDRITAYGYGYVGISSVDGGEHFTFGAVPMNGAHFECWRNVSDGSFVSSNPELSVSIWWLSGIETELVGCFAGDPIVPGDADGDGAVSIVDALLVLRYSMGIEPDIGNFSAADVNGDGIVDLMDALEILRLAMGVRDQGAINLITDN